MDKADKISMRMSCLALAVGIYAARGVVAGIVTFIIAWIFMLILEEGGES